jgi:hypothetical protein
MPPTEEQIDEAIETLSKVRLESFTATPNAIRPFGDSTLSWRVVTPPGVVVTLLGVPVPATGTRVVHPGLTTAYSLDASRLGVRRHLRSVVVTVNASDCIGHSIPERDIRGAIQQEFEAIYGGDGKVVEKFKIKFTITLRRPVNVEVDASGIRVQASFNIGIPNFWDATLDADARNILTAENGQPVTTVRTFNSDFDLPWQAWVIGGLGGFAGVGITKVMEELVDSEIGPSARESIRAGIEGNLKKNLELLQAVRPDLHLFSLTTTTDRIVATVCPNE